MEFNRRDLLKFFGAGTIIAPVVNGLTVEDTRAKLIETPKLGLVELPPVIEAKSIDPGDFDAVIYLRSRKDNTVKRIDCACNIVDLRGGLLIREQSKLLHFDTDHRYEFKRR